MNHAFFKATALGLAVLSLGLAGCGKGDTPAPAFNPNGQPKNNDVQYPDGPYGVTKGAIIENFQFVGFQNSQVKNDETQPIALSDFYNPTGDGTFPADSLYGANQAKPRVLLIDVASTWCGPCNQEAGNVLPGQYKKYQPLGAEFMLQLADGPNQGVPATTLDLTKWTKKYKVNYPATIDPAYKLGALFPADAYPANMIIDTRTMTICEIIAGAPDPTDPTVGIPFWKKLENVASDPDACLKP